MKRAEPNLAPLVEWRARRIEDPIERLRFLRLTNRGRQPRSVRDHLYRFLDLRVVVSAALWASFFIPVHSPSRARAVNAPPALRSAAAPVTDSVPQVWPVEKTRDFELYSNGLRIENEFAVAGRRRTAYPVYRLQPGPDDARPMEWRAEPAGIVFHSTESHQVAFEPSETGSLKRVGRLLLEYVRSQQAYHFVIDRFGRVFRVVAESSIANHAGNSVWADDQRVYINLNRSFLSIAFESQTDASLPLSAAQIHAAKVLTDLLRSQFKIPAANCITHAQVSVNPSNMRIGYHTDWASGLPFAALGLPDNYSQILPSLSLFGFDYDESFMAAARGPWAGLIAAERSMDEQALAGRLSASEYRQRLRDRYRKITGSAHGRSSEENHNASSQ